MKKGKFFCKLLGMAFATFMIFSGTVVNNCTYAFPTKTIVENAFKNELYRCEFKPEEMVVIGSFNIKTYDDFLIKISEQRKKEEKIGSFIEKHKENPESLDSAYFLLFLRLISNRCEELKRDALTQNIIIKIAHDRSTEEGRSDKILADEFDKLFGMNLKFILTYYSPRTLKNLCS